ncbi:cytochrome P450 [Pseudonocardia sp. KRD291]|uniref:cytochrome P450 n=1 Tax=Pseudonocardia sp. KRD291 TaxID=2792007 RepID=UPI001C4A46AF|nr:cytochrome P450 [Pseudonocardia sp. KRD291]MBW0103767.1 cytochrome P450 [Pseudonocardia sp. KRD291]
MTGAIADDLLTAQASADPYAVFDALRREDPVHWSGPHRAWLVTRYADVSAAFADKALSNDRVRPVLAKQREERERNENQHGARRAEAGGDDGRPASASERVLALMSGWMVVSDPPVHTRLRKLAAGAFKGQRIAVMDARITALVDELLDGFLRGSGEQDLISEVAYPLPATVIATMLGAPPSDRDLFREWSDELALVAFGTGGAARAERHERALRGLNEMDAYFRGLVAQRRAEPGEDMLSAMMSTDESDTQTSRDGLSDDELVAMCALLLFAGHETTTNSIANATLALLRDPAALAALREDPSLLNTAVEELLRYDGPIKVINRWVVAETELAGRTILPGERVHLVLASADRDPDKFADPDTLDLTRSPNPHVAFGKGIHACIGAQLARMETRIAVGRIVERLPGLALAREPVWKDALASRSMETLVVTH